MTTPSGKRSRNDPPRQMAWMMTRADTEPDRDFTLVFDAPAIVGTVVESSDLVAVMSMKNVPKRNGQSFDSDEPRLVLTNHKLRAVR